jgi:hypothetical protein
MPGLESPLPPHCIRSPLLRNPDPTPPRVSRRTLLKVGIAGGAALLCARWLYTATESPPARAENPAALDPAARAVVMAIIPVFLDGALPDGPDAASARAETFTGVERIIAGLPPATRKELVDLFSLLAFPPTRGLIAGIWSPWPEATGQALASFLARWRDSRFALLRSGYAALHQLVFSAWYANPRAWPAIGYPGPPRLGIG